MNDLLDHTHNHVKSIYFWKKSEMCACFFCDTCFHFAVSVICSPVIAQLRSSVEFCIKAHCFMYIKHRDSSLMSTKIGATAGVGSLSSIISSGVTSSSCLRQSSEYGLVVTMSWFAICKCVPRDIVHHVSEIRFSTRKVYFCD